MCAQCAATAATAMTAGVAATGARAWLAASLRDRISPAVLRAVTVVLLTLGVLAAATAIG